MTNNNNNCHSKASKEAAIDMLPDKNSKILNPIIFVHTSSREVVMSYV
jgi:hypothetical protein